MAREYRLQQDVSGSNNFVASVKIWGLIKKAPRRAL